MLKKITILLRIVFLLCAVFIVIGLYQFNENIEKNGKLQEMKLLSASANSSALSRSSNDNSAAISQNSENTTEASLSSNDGEPQILPEYRELHGINPDMVGWLKIDGTNIDYPVVRCSDMDYYLSHDFYKNEDKNGTPFVKSFADVDSPDDNFIVYAHNMKNGTMFGNLDDYENESFAKEHSIIEFDSLYEKRRYRVISVFRSEVYSEDADNEDKFKYYEYYNAGSEEDFAYFYGNIMHLSAVKTGVKASYGDRFITLSTCAYHTDNGRFVVVGKEID